MTSTRKSGFWPLPLSTCAHMRLTASPPFLDPATFRRHGIHVTLLQRLVGLQWNSGLYTEIRLYCDCNLFKTVLSIIYSTNLYWRKISNFYSAQRRNSGTKYANFFTWEEDRIMSMGSNFLYGSSNGAAVQSILDFCNNLGNLLILHF